MTLGDSDELVGRTIAGKFAIESSIGHGAMGRVYRAQQVALDKPIALKVLHRELTRDPQFTGRFLREAQAASRIDHPNSMRVLDYGAEPDGLLYIAMELLEGQDLFTFLRREWPLSVRRTTEIVMQVLAALAVAHDMGVVHRDLKPENIMVSQRNDDEGVRKDFVKVCDFGIAKMTASRNDVMEDGRPSPRLTSEGLIVGTPEYMSPEQGRGEPLDPRSDIYAVGVILYQILVGRVPFDADTPLGVVLRHVTEAPERPSLRVAAVDPRLEAIALKALAKRPSERFDNARDMRAELRKVVESEVDLDGPASLASRSALQAASGAPADEAGRENDAIAPTAVALQTPHMAGADGAEGGGGSDRTDRVHFEFPMEEGVPSSRAASHEEPRALRRRTSESLLPPPQKRATGFLIGIPIFLAAAGGAGLYALNATRAVAVVSVPTASPPPDAAASSPFVPPADLGGTPVPSAAVPSASAIASAGRDLKESKDAKDGRAKPATASSAPTSAATPKAGPHVPSPSAAAPSRPREPSLDPLPTFPIPTASPSAAPTGPAAPPGTASAPPAASSPGPAAPREPAPTATVPPAGGASSGSPAAPAQKPDPDPVTAP